MEFTVTFEGEAAAVLQRLGEGLGDREALHATMAFAVEALWRDHLDSEGYTSRPNKLGGKSTGYWKGASQSIASEASAEGATISMSQRGLALHYFGGVVKPVSAKALSIPVHPSAHGVYARQYPGPLAFIPAGRAFGPVRKGGRQDDHFVGFLVRGEERVVTRGKNKGQTRTLPVKGGETIYILRTQTTHEPDPNIVPGESAMITAAAEAGATYLESLIQSNNP
jgi:hypothetical protein